MRYYREDEYIEMVEGSEEQRDQAGIEYLDAQREADQIDSAIEVQRCTDVVEAIILDSIVRLDHATALAQADFRRQCDAARRIV